MKTSTFLLFKSLNKLKKEAGYVMSADERSRQEHRGVKPMFEASLGHLKPYLEQQNTLLTRALHFH